MVANFKEAVSILEQYLHSRIFGGYFSNNKIT
jgi:hypothetical protein